MRIPFLSPLLKSKTRGEGLLAIDLAARGFCLARVDFAGAIPKVVRCSYHETGAVTAADLERLKREQNIGDFVCTTLLASGEYQMMMVDAPNVPTTELKTAIRWKIKDGLSYHIDDATVDVLQIPTNKYGSDRGQSLYAIAAPNGIIQKRIALFEQAKMELGVIDIPETAQRNIAALFEQENFAVVLLTFDENGGLLTFTAGGELFLSRRIEISASQLRDANEELLKQSLNRVELELQRSLDYFDRQYNHLPVSRVLISAPSQSGLVEFLSGMRDVKIGRLDLSQVMDTSAVPALADSEFLVHALPVIGAALRQERRVI